MGLTYRIPPGVHVTQVQGHPALTTAQGGKIIMDRLMIDLWQQAGNQDINTILTNPGPNRDQGAAMRAALACLVEAGLLQRDTNEDGDRLTGDAPPIGQTIRTNELISVIIVAQNSQAWLEKCIPSLLDQSHVSLEIIIVDNGSTDQTITWMKERFQKEIQLIILDQVASLSNAINQGVDQAHGKYFLLLNPDVVLHHEAIAQMVSVAKNKPECAAVAAKLRLLWAPGFLNGLGNYVGAISWGGDSALGHLDLGQFNHWTQVPSACFAAALIPRQAWEAIGPLDANFPLYYEDSEWCYRGRLLGYQVIAAPQAVVYHAFGGHGQTPHSGQLSPSKLQSVVYGRLRFITKLLNTPRLLRFLLSYFVEDCCRLLIALVQGRRQIIKSHLLGWRDFLKSLKTLAVERRKIQAGRKITDTALFSPQRRSPIPLIWHGYPLLTWDLLRNQYLKIILSQENSRFPEFDHTNYEYTQQLAWSRILKIWRIEGLAGLLHHTGKYIQWRLSQP